MQGDGGEGVEVGGVKEFVTRVYDFTGRFQWYLCKLNIYIKYILVLIKNLKQ